jgi:putative DNA primase/helicase
VCGYCLTGSVREHALFFGYGGGGNGKGVFLNTATRIMGDYAATSTMEAFAASSYDRHSTELAMLHGARIVTARETEEGRYWAESRIKQITGGDPVTARYLYRDNFTYSPTFKLFVVGNHMPKLKNVDDAIRRRMNTIPFKFKPALVNMNLEEELEPEYPGILAWMIAGCLEWQRIGLQPPQVVTEETREYFAGEDLIGRWLDERCAQSADAFTLSTALYEDFQEWCATNGEQSKSKNTFCKGLSGRGTARGRDESTEERGFRLALKERVATW